MAAWTIADDYQATQDQAAVNRYYASQGRLPLPKYTSAEKPKTVLPVYVTGGGEYNKYFDDTEGVDRNNPSLPNPDKPFDFSRLGWVEMVKNWTPMTSGEDTVLGDDAHNSNRYVAPTPAPARTEESSYQPPWADIVPASPNVAGVMPVSTTASGFYYEDGKWHKSAEGGAGYVNSPEKHVSGTYDPMAWAAWQNGSGLTLGDYSDSIVTKHGGFIDQDATNAKATAAGRIRRGLDRNRSNIMMQNSLLVGESLLEDNNSRRSGGAVREVRPA